MGKSNRRQYCATKMAKDKRKQEAGKNLTRRVEQITKSRQDGNIPQVLKAFKNFNRKPYTPIKELIGKENQSIVTPDGIRKQIDKHIEEILHGPTVNHDTAQFREHLNRAHLKDDILSQEETQEILNSNEKGEVETTVIPTQNKPIIIYHLSSKHHKL